MQPAIKEKRAVRGLARQLLFIWSALGARVMRDLTLAGAPSFGKNSRHYSTDLRQNLRIVSKQFDDGQTTSTTNNKHDRSNSCAADI